MSRAAVNAAVKGQHGAETAGDPYVPRHGNGGYTVSRYDLTLNYRIPTNRLTGRAEISATALQPLAKLSLDLANLRSSKVKVNGQPAAKFTQTGNKLHIWPAGTLPAGSTFRLLVRYEGNPTTTGGPWGQLGWEELTDGVLIASQPTGAPTWFPCNDHPSNKAAYRISITTDSAYRVVTNGTLTDLTMSRNRATWIYDQLEPMAPYLATVQIGRYEIVELAADPVRTLAAVPARRRNAAKSDFRRQQDMMKLFIRMFGPYPFVEYTVIVTDDPLDIPLEAQGLSVFGSNYVDGRRSHERLIAHELAHQWFGNSVTLDSWQHIWLHEGFACYAEWLWAENSGGPAPDIMAAAARETLKLRPQDLAIGDPGPDRMFDDRVYVRGALTLHTLRRQMGDESFFPLIREWVAQNRHSTTNTQAFVDLATRRGASRQLLRRWLFDTALPS